MRVLVTGGLGYIGTRVVRKLLDNGHEVVILDLGIYETPLVTEYVEGAEIERLDICDPDTWEIVRQHGEFDWCFALAAISNDPSADLDTDLTYRVNVDGMKLIADYCAAAGTPIIFSSTASIFGHVEWAISMEGDRPNPQSAYAVSKVMAEEYLQEQSKSAGLQAVILRQATVFGWSPRMRYDLVVNALIRSALTTGKLVAHGAGECWRPLVAVNDLADIWCHIAETRTDQWWDAQDGCPVFNITHKSYRISELIWWMTLLLQQKGIDCEMVRDTMQSKDNRDYSMDGSRAQHAGIVAPTGITEAIDELLEKIGDGVTADFENPIYANVPWLKKLAEEGA